MHRSTCHHGNWGWWEKSRGKSEGKGCVRWAIERSQVFLGENRRTYTTLMKNEKCSRCWIDGKRWEHCFLSAISWLDGDMVVWNWYRDSHGRKGGRIEGSAGMPKKRRRKERTGRRWMHEDWDLFFSFIIYCLLCSNYPFPGPPKRGNHMPVCDDSEGPAGWRMYCTFSIVSFFFFGSVQMGSLLTIFQEMMLDLEWVKCMYVCLCVCWAFFPQGCLSSRQVS